MLVILLIVGGLMFFGLVAWIALGGVAKIEHDQKKAEANSTAILDEAFDGRPDVTFNLHMRTLKYETVILGAKERGYTLAHQAGDPNGAMTLIFEKSGRDETPPS